MSIVLGGVRYDTPGLESISWLDDPSVPRTDKTTPRSGAIRAIVFHTTSGLVGPLRPGSEPSTRAEHFAHTQATDSREASWDFTVDTDGTVVQSNDPVRQFTWHANQVNPYTLGIEMVQDSDGSTYEDQVTAAVRLADFLARELQLPRQIPWSNGGPTVGVLQRLTEAGGSGADVYGAYGHRNVTTNRGPGDPGDHIFEALYADGWEGFDLAAGADKAAWRARQAALGVAVDGAPGPATMAAWNAAQASSRAGAGLAAVSVGLGLAAWLDLSRGSASWLRRVLG
jgi:hypothetical protein